MSLLVPEGMLAQAPKKVSLEGIVTEYNSKEPLAGCVVAIPTLELWVVSDAKGRFRMPSVTTGTYNIEVTCLGYEPLSYNVTITDPIGNLSLRVKETSLQLNTVTVTAKKGASINTSSTIDRQAMDHLQATSVKDVIQLLPGVLTSKPDLNSPTSNFVGIRDLVGGEEATQSNSSSVGVYVNGASMSNDASLVGTKSGSFGQKTDRGIDMRQISTDNIESIEVIRGVASAEYGNMSAGAVIVKTKSGRTPYEVRAKITPNVKIVALNKGFALGANKGFLNTSLDYANSMNDIRTQKNAFDRTTFSIGYNNTFNRDRKPLSFNAIFTGGIAAGTTKADADNVSNEELYTLNNSNFSMNLNGSWLINKPWITALRYVVNTNVSREFTRDYSASSFVGVANPGSLIDGEFITERTPDSYYTDRRNHSLAIYTNAKVVGELSGRYGAVYNKAMVGLEWNNSGNTGKGLYYEGIRPEKFRPQPFRDIPFMNKMSVFVEDKATLPIGKTSLTLQAGFRFTWMGTDVLKKNTNIDPRFNVKYTIVQNRMPKSFRELSVRAGWGIQTTMPSFWSLYPFANYEDRAALTWGGTSTLSPVDAWTTLVTPREMMQNPDLKLQNSKNFEVGIDFDIAGIVGSVTYYNEKMRNGYSTISSPTFVTFREYDATNINATPIYMDDPQHPGTQVLSVNGVPIPYQDQVKSHLLSKPGNNSKYDKWGVEYTLNFGQIQPIRTTVMVTGAYMNMTNLDNEGEQIYVANSNSSSKYNINGKQVYNPFVMSYSGGKSIAVGTTRQRLNSNISLITHIPKLRLIATLTIQCVWIDKSQRLQNTNVYMLDEQGNPVYGDFSQGAPSGLYKDPDYYMDAAGNVRVFDRALYSDPTYGAAARDFVENAGNSNMLMQWSLKPYFMANLRITKEIGRLAQISFYAENFTNSRPLIYNEATGNYQTLNTPISFGAELKLKF